MSGLANCSTNENKLVKDELIGCRIEVWWPMDKRFYEGTVKSYDSTKQRHVILYEDGDVEVLNLDKDRWELIDTGGKPAKKSRTSKGSSYKKRSSESKPKNSDGLQRDEDPITTTPKGKRTPKKNPKGTPRSLSLEHEKLESRNKKRRSFATPSEVAGKKKGKKMNSVSEAGTEYSGEVSEEKSESEGKSLKEGEDDEEVVNKEEDLQETETESSGDAEGKEAEHDNSDTEGKQENNEMETEAEDDAETSDNETLGAWKSKVGKSSLRKAI